jgi:ribitol-5-phosphate 2-dehydrogenase (NADP+)
MKLPLNVKEYILVAPGTIETRDTTIDFVPSGFTVLSPLVTAICGSDVHYYGGEKSAKKLKERLPLVPLHEGVCIDLATGARVVPLGGYAMGVPEEFVGHENIWPDLPYLGATNHGLARTHFLYPKELLIPVPESVSDEVASLTEPFSVALRAIRDLGIDEKDKIAVIGTGGIAYLLVLALRFEHGIKKEQMTVLGVSDASLKPFNELAETVKYKNEAPETLRGKYNVVFEVVGGAHIAKTVETAFFLVRPGGKVGILGISDLDVTLPMNKLVNYGINVHGLTRSTAEEYALALKLFGNAEIHAHAARGVNDIRFVADSVHAVRDAFLHAKKPGVAGRVVIHWPRETK